LWQRRTGLFARVHITIFALGRSLPSCLTRA
jgi:hypothetical protein